MNRKTTILIISQKQDHTMPDTCSHNEDVRYKTNQFLTQHNLKDAQTYRREDIINHKEAWAQKALDDQAEAGFTYGRIISFSYENIWYA